MNPENNSLISPTSSNVTSYAVPSNTAIAGPTKELSAGEKAGIGFGAAAVATVLFTGLLLFHCWRLKRRKSLRTAKSQEFLSLQDSNSPTHHEAHELDATEPPVELSASAPSIQESTGFSTEPLESAPPTPIVDLPEYPRQPAIENQEPKSLNQVLEKGGLEPKSLDTPQERPRRPP
jgi:hypothetical protein